MTLQKFSDKSFRSMFKTGLKSAVLFPVVGMIILSIIVVVEPFIDVVALNNPDYYGRPYDVILENVRYILFGQLGTDEGGIAYAILMYVTVIIAAMLCAIITFKNLSSKKTANVYYSLGFSRSKLFASTYLSGAVSVLGMVVIPFALSFIINAFAFGISKELISACIFTVSVLCNVSLLAYTISSIAMTLSGMLVEGVFFSFFLNAISPIFTFSACLFSEGLLTGGGFVEADDFYSTSFETSFFSAFLGKLSFLNGLSHSVYEVGGLGSCIFTSEGVYTPEHYGIKYTYLSVENWTTPNFIPLLVWSVILAGLVFLSLCLFNRRKVENIGFFASNPLLYRIFFGTLIVGFSSLGCMSGRTITKGLTWLYILITLAVCLVVTTILTLILTRISRINFKKEVKAFGIYSLAVILFACIFSTGFFGYQNRIPAVEKVASVEITSFAPTNNDFYYPSEIYCGNYDDVSPVTMQTFSTYDKFFFSSKSDIASIQELHKGLIEADNTGMSNKYDTTKVSAKINIIYTLKDGKTISRSYYRITPELIEKYISYNGVSEEIKNEMISHLEYMISSIDDNDDYYNDYVFKEFFTVFSNDLTTAHNVELTKTQLHSLLAAYTMDVENHTAKELLQPKGKTLGILAIRSDWSVLGEYNEATGTEEFIGMGSQLEFDNLTTNNSTDNGSGFITITDDMTNTIKWAKGVGIFKYFTKDKNIKIAGVEATHNNSSSIKLELANRSNLNLVFLGRSYRYGDKYAENNFNGNVARLAGSHYVTGLTEEEIKVLRNNASPYYLTTETGYFIKFTTNEADSLCTTVFVPDSKLTPELKIKLAVDTENGTEDVTTVGIEHSQYHEPTTYIAN